jgi:hypothetical protein
MKIGKQMNKAEWDKAHNYTRERNCAFCKHARDISTDFYAAKLRCLEKEKAGAGARPASRQIIAVICGNIVNTGNSRRTKNDG